MGRGIFECWDATTFNPLRDSDSLRPAGDSKMQVVKL